MQCQREEDKKCVLGLKKYYLFFLIVYPYLRISNIKVVLLFLYFVLWCKGNTWVFGPHIVGSSPIGGTCYGDVDYGLGHSPFKAKDKVQILTSLLIDYVV